MNQDIHEEKTEQPTERKIKKFRKKGTTRYSRELNSILVLLIGFFSIWWLKDVIILKIIHIMSNSFSFNQEHIMNSKKKILDVYIYLQEILLVLFSFFTLLIITIIIPAILFSGIKLRITSFKFNIHKLNIFNGLKRMFSYQVIIEFVKILVKLILICGISVFYLWSYFFELLSLINESYISGLSHGLNIVFSCCFLVLLGLIPVVGIDILWQQFNHYKKLKMTHQEIKDEFKEYEGNSIIKSRIRQLMKLASEKRMMLDVPKADVIITNPVNYSIALMYNQKNMNAPKVIAKGIGQIAIQIQKLAIKHNISVIEAPLLARSLYRFCNIGQYIPGPLYKAVAEVLAWVWKVRKWKKEGGDFPEKPKNISVPSEFNITGEHQSNV